jgi:hypothetical protein
MYVYLINAQAHASWDEYEAWSVVAETPEQAWALVLEESSGMLPYARTYDDRGYQVDVQPVRAVELADMTVEVLGTGYGTPRVAFAALLRG